MSNNLPTITIQKLLEAGVHFGHKKSRWNPKMAPYIYGIKDDIHIIDLRQTIVLLRTALKVICEVVRKNGRILFVGTKVQTSALVAECAEKCGQYYINHRWLGGTLTNWKTVSESIKTLVNLEKILDDQEENLTYTKKEILDFTRKKDKILRSLGGIRNMGGAPKAIVVLDTNGDKLAVQEAKKLDIPVIAVVDTNSDPDGIDYPIPGNDDSIKAVTLYCELFADSALIGIENALAESGIDLGEISEQKYASNNKKVVKFDNKQQHKRNRPLKTDDETQKSSEEFESLLEKSN